MGRRGVRGPQQFMNYVAAQNMGIYTIYIAGNIYKIYAMGGSRRESTRTEATARSSCPVCVEQSPEQSQGPCQN